MYLTKLNWYLLLTKGSYCNSTVEERVVVSLLIILYTTTLYNSMCTRMRACCVKVLASYIASSATVAKQTLEVFNSAQCIHELLSILICL